VEECKQRMPTILADSRLNNFASIEACSMEELWEWQKAKWYGYKN